MSQSKYQAGFGVTFWGKKSQTLMIPIYSTTVLYDMEELVYSSGFFDHVISMMPFI